MMRFFTIVATIMLMASSALCAPMYWWPTPRSSSHPLPLSTMTLTSPDQAEAKRAEINTAIFGVDHVPYMQPFSVTSSPLPCCGEDQISAFGRAPSMAQWLSYRFYVPTHGGSYPYIVTNIYYARFPGSSCLAIVNFGHNGGLFKYPGHYYSSAFDEPSANDLIKRLAAIPCDLLINSMLLNGGNKYFLSYLGYGNDDSTIQIHNIVGTTESLAPPIGTPEQYFILPALSAIDYALAQRSYSKVMTTGYSGGGWISSILAALETRITHSYAVAGSSPVEYWPSSTFGDWEQSHVPVSYFDLYALSAAEDRRSVLMYNGLDACCFSWTTFVSPWAAEFASALSDWPGRFSIVVDGAAVIHQISPDMATVIISDFSK